MRPRVPSVAVAAVLVLGLLGPNPVGPSSTLAAACTAAQIKPELGAVMVNQGLTDYPVLVRGKQALVRLFLRLPTTCTTSSTVSMLGASLQVERVGSLDDTPVPGTTPISLTPSRTVSGKLTAGLNNDATWDPIFLLPGSLLAPAGTVPPTGTNTPWRLRLTATLTWKVGSGASVTGAPATTGGGPTNPFYQAVDKRTNAFRILVVPMGDARQGYATQFPAADQAALTNGIAAFGRMGPFPDGVNSLTDNAGGLRYTINPSLLDVGPGGLNLMINGKWCGRDSNFSIIKGPLAAMLDQYNLANPQAPADRVLGVAGATISSGASAGCDEGRGEIPSSGVAGRVAWVRAIPATSKVPSITGPLIAMEMLHTVGGCADDPNVPNTTDRCPGTFHSINSEAEALNRAYNLTTRSFVLADRTAMRLQAAASWHNDATFYERNDYALLQCALGGATTVGGQPVPGCDPNRLVGTASGVAAGPIFVLSGTTDGQGGTTAPCAIPGRSAPGTRIVDSYFADLTGQPIPPLSDEDTASDYRLIYRNSLGAVIRDFGVATAGLGEKHGDDETGADGADGISLITEFDANTQVVELVHRPAIGPDEVLYCRTRTARPIVEGAVSVPDTGRLVFDSTRSGDADIYSMDGSGGDVVQLTDDPATDHQAEVSHDGTRIAFASDRDGDFEIYVMNLDGSGLTKVTDNADYDANPTWSPTGDRIAFEHKTGAAPTSTADEVNIVVSTTGPSPVATQLTDGQHDITPAWRPVGEEIVFNRANLNLWWVGADAALVDHLLYGYSVQDPAWSPDGSELALAVGGDIELLNWPDANSLITVTSTATPEASPTYSRSGDYITFQRTVPPIGGPEPTRIDVYRINLTDLLDIEKLTGGGTVVAPHGFEFVRRWGASGSGTGQFNTPDDVALAPDGTLYVTDTFNHRIQHYSDVGTLLGGWGSLGTGNGQFNNPVGIAVAPDGSVWVTDNSNHRLQHFTAAGAWIATFGSFGNGTSQLFFPGGVDLDPAGNVYVADQGNRRIQVLSPGGTFSSFPTGLYPTWLDWSAGRLHVVINEGSTKEVRTFTDTGTLVGPTLGTYNTANGPGQIVDPWSVEAGPHGLVYLVDGYGELQVYRPSDGSLVVQAGQSGTGDQVLSQPRGLAVTPEGAVFFTEAGLDGVKLWDAWEGDNTPGNWTPNADAADAGAAATIVDDYPDLTRATLYFQCAPSGERFPIAVGLEPNAIDAATAGFFATTDTSALCGDGTPTVTGIVSDGFWSTPIDADPGTIAVPDPDIDPLPVASDRKPPTAAIAAPAPLIDENLVDETAVLPAVFLDTDSIALAGSGTDPEDGDLCVVDPEATAALSCQLTWRLSHGADQVLLGAGGTLDLHPRDPAGGPGPVPGALAPFVVDGRWDPGLYELELVATDADGSTGSAFASFVIEATPPEDTTPPSLAVTHVPDGLAGWDVSDPTAVSVAADDPATLATLGCTVDAAPAVLDPVFTPGVASYAGTVVVSGDGSHEVSCTASDGSGNATDPPATHPVAVDATPATVVVTGPANGATYVEGSVPVAGCSTTDTGSGVATHASPVTTGDAPAPGTWTVTCTGAADAAGNLSPDPSVSFTVTPLVTGDTTPPIVAVTGIADGAAYPLGSVPAAGCSTEDELGGSGVATYATLSGPNGGTANGVGSYTVTCSGGEDAAGNVAASVSATYSVVFADVSGVLQPINPDDTSIFSRGRVIPVKIQLGGDPVTGFATTGWRIDLLAVSCSNFDIADAIVENVPSNTPSTSFRYDSATDTYLFNADLKSKPVGSCFRFRIALDDGPHTALPTSPSQPRPPAPTVIFSGVFKLKK